MRTARDHICYPPMPSIRCAPLSTTCHDIENARFNVRNPFEKELESKSGVRTQVWPSSACRLSQLVECSTHVRRAATEPLAEEIYDGSGERDIRRWVDTYARSHQQRGIGGRATSAL